ncbi:hypothetical protein M011DRAFT_423237 [Sporormia fimetaria CBS 119925]|uniref:F-box domain-containing protein n=1 Tax=Sporormia fimetaria CBS 119925 TaxID=1340428 RepID=A0A6A6VD83_9PLEO|nr:hypothetical protein M011DRAFT_423237 [Sporormia fimetaria CBS 119925]
MTSTEAELESFRQQWLQEVTQKTKGAPQNTATSNKIPQASSSRSHVPKTSNASAVAAHARHRSVEEVDDVEPHSYPDLGEVQHGRKLGDTSKPSVSTSKEPVSALDHYEKAVEKESQGTLGESLNLYRRAFKLDANVDKLYKKKHFPASAFPSKSKTQNVNPSNASVTVPNTAHHSLHGLSKSLQSMIESFASFHIEGEPAPTEFSPAPPCPIASIPDEILAEILLYSAIDDIASFVRLAQVCKRLAYLVTTEERIWKRIATGLEVGFEAMHYTYACRIDGKPLGDDGEGGYILGSDSDDEVKAEPPALGSLTTLLVPSVYPTYRALFRQRPRVRFNGLYISTVNYTRPGANSNNGILWNSPIHIVTYYRYLRFFRNGQCISLLTTSEPTDVVPYLHMEQVHKNHGNLPSAPMKDALLGRWRLSGPAIPGLEEEGNGEKEGMLHIETDGAHPKYLFKMVLSMGSAGRGARNNKLSWDGYWSYNRLTDDWAEFGRKNERPFYWSRVKSYGAGVVKDTSL